MPFTTQTLNAFDMTGRLAACEIDANGQGNRAFIGVYPPSKKDSRWLVRRFEIPAALVAQYFGEEDLRQSEMIWLTTLEDVEALLASWCVDSSKLDAPWKSDYPL
jgi:hypothetical protein